MSEWCDDCQAHQERLELACKVISNLWVVVGVIAAVESKDRRKQIAATIDKCMGELAGWGDGEATDIGGEA